jgi:hypothetical protein
MSCTFLKSFFGNCTLLPNKLLIHSKILKR